MNPPMPPLRTPEVEVIRAQTEATRARAEAAKEIVATALRGFVPLGVFGIAVGATAIVLEMADRGLHLAGLLVIWISATVFSIVAVVSGLLERQRFRFRKAPADRKTLELEIEEARNLLSAIQE
jgi:hypothetical protein